MLLPTAAVVCVLLQKGLQARRGREVVGVEVECHMIFVMLRGFVT